MLTKNKFKEYVYTICNQVHRAQDNQIGHTLIYDDESSYVHKNEFILFIKPGVTLKNENIKLRNIVQLVLDKIDEFGLSINLIKILPGKYLEEYNIMAQHYGVINKLSANVKEEMSEPGALRFKEIFNTDFVDADVYGGHEFLKKFPELTPLTLSMLWQNSGFQKLTSGTYAGNVTFDGKKYYLVNGFHPRQLIHFNGIGRSIVVFSLTGDLDWAVARNDFVGLTDPAKAENGSIRNEMFMKKDELGIPIFNSAYNGVHLSAGPVEALNELIRFCSDYTDKNKIKKLEDFRIGRILSEHFNTDQLSSIIDNEKIEKNGHVTTSFDLTEEKNTDDIINILKSYYN